MVRKGPWKYITFGHTLSTFSKQDYPAQLFNVDADPDELSDVSAKHKDVLAELDADLNAAFDPQDADRRAITEDKAMYDRFFASLSEKALKKKMKAAYTGFDDDDWKKIQ